MRIPNPQAYSPQNAARAESDLLKQHYIKEYTTFVYDGRRGISNLLRETLLRHELGFLSLVLDILYCCGYKSRQRFSYAQIKHVFEELHVTERAARSGLDYLKIGTQKGKRGRPSNLYELPTMASVEIWVGLNPKNKNMIISDPLRAGDIGNLPAYRLGMYREFISRTVMTNGDKEKSHQRAFLADRLNVSTAATRHYDKLLNVQVSHKFEYGKIFGKGMVESTINFEKHQKAVCLVITESPDSINVLYRAPLLPVVAYTALNRGRGVFTERQLPNTYYLEPTGAYMANCENRIGFDLWTTSANELLASYSEEFEI